MVRVFAVSLVLSCLAAPAWAQPAQVQPTPATAATPATAPATKSVAKKPASKTRTAAKPSEQANSGPCRLGVIPAVGDQFVVQKVGFTVFGNELTEMSTSWGLDDLVVARVRAAAGGIAVRRIAYTKGAFSAPAPQPGLLFRDTRTELNNIVRQVAAGSNCERYVLVTRAGSNVGGTNQAVHGIGIVNWNALPTRVYLFAVTYIRIFDGQTFAVIKQDSASTGDEFQISRVLLATPIRGPYRQLDEASFPASPAEAITNPALREGVRALLTTSLDKTLPSLLAP